MQYWLTSKALWNLGWSTWNCCHTIDQTERCFPFQALLSLKEISLHLRLSPSSQYFLLKFSCAKAVSPPTVLCEVENCLLPWIKFQIFCFYTVNIHRFRPPRIILSLVFSGTQGIPTCLKKLCLITHKQGSNKYVASLNVLLPTYRLMLMLIAASCSICPGAQWLSWGTTWNKQCAHVLPIAGVWIPACFKSKLLDSNMCNPFFAIRKIIPLLKTSGTFTLFFF